MRGQWSDGPEQMMLRLNRTVSTEGTDGSEPQGHRERQIVIIFNTATSGT